MNEMEIRDKFLRGNRLKINLAWLLTIAIIACTIIFSFSYFGGNSGSSKAHRSGSENGWVYDNDGILSDSTISEINAKNGTLYSSSGAEIVVAIEKDSSKNKNLPKRAEDLFKQYKVSDNGVLFIVAVPDIANSSGIGAAINEVIDNVTSSLGIETELYAYSYCLGRNVDYKLGDMIEQKFESAFYEYYDKGNYNGAVLSMFDDIYLGYYYGGSIGATYTVPDNSYSAETRVETGFISTIAIIVLGIFMIMIFSKRRRVYTPSRVYRSPNWFGLGLGMGLGMNRRHHHNHHSHRPHNHGGFGGSFFNGMNGMNGRSGGNRTGGGSRSGGSSFGSSGRTGGGFRSGGSSSGRSGGGFRSGGGSRGGGGRRR